MSGLLASHGRELVLAAAWAGGGMLGGLTVGGWRNRRLAGVLLGGLLGPLGWIIVAALPGRFRECPGCSRPLRVQARRCRRCGIDVERTDARSRRSEVRGLDAAKRPW